MTKLTPKAKAKAKAKAKTKPKTTKPFTPSQLLDKIGVDAILERIAEGDYYSVIAKDVGVARNTMLAWLQNNYSDLYAHAREARADKIAEDILEIADDSASDKYTDQNGVERTDSEVVAR